MANEGIKVIYIINSLTPGGAELGLKELIHSGLFSNVDLTIVALSKANSELENSFKKIKNIHIYFLSLNDIKITKIPSYIITFKKIVSEIEPDFVISSLAQSTLVARLVKLFNIKHKFKLITFEHNTNYQNKNAYKILKFTDFLTNHFWCDSSATQRALLDRFPDAKNDIVPLFYVKSTEGLKTDYRIIDTVKLASIGRLAPQKNHANAIRLIKQLNDNYTNAELTIFGDGPIRAELLELVKKLQLEDKIHFAGFVDQWVQEIVKYDIYLLMSDHEGLSISTLEAMSKGIPCLVKRVGELKNYIENNVNGLSFDENNDAFELLIKLINDEQLREKIGRGGYFYVTENHSKQMYLTSIAHIKYFFTSEIHETNKN